MKLFPNKPILNAELTYYDDVITVNEYTKLLKNNIKLKYDETIINIVARGEDYYSTGFKCDLELMPGKNISEIIGKILVKIIIDEHPNNNIYKKLILENHKNYISIYSSNWNDIIQHFVHYVMIFTDNTELKFLIINKSFGPYDRYIEIIEISAVKEEKKYNSNILTFIIGLPGSGKTTLAHEISRKGNYRLFDDFITNYASGEFINSLTDFNNIVVIDPRLCKIDIFEAIIKKISIIIPEEHIMIILYENDPDTCINNIKNREKNIKIQKKLCSTVKSLSKVYNPENEKYNKYSSEIISCFGSIKKNKKMISSKSYDKILGPKKK